MTSISEARAEVQLEMQRMLALVEARNPPA